MKAVLICLVLCAASCLFVDQAQAAPAVTITATTFATDTTYCGDGSVTVSGTLIVSGGTSGFVGEHCRVTVLEKGRLSFVDAHLSGAEYFDVLCGSKCHVKFDNSSVEGSVVLVRTDGSDAGGQRITVLNNSRLESTEQEVYVYAREGVVDIDHSTIKSGGGSDDFISVYTSADQKKDTVTVEDSTLDAGSGDIHVTTSAGKTTVRDATLNAANRFISSGGKCTSKGNTPDTPCT